MSNELILRLESAITDGRISLRGLAAAMDYNYDYLKRRMFKITTPSATDTVVNPPIVEVSKEIQVGYGAWKTVPNHDYALLPEFAIRLILKMRFKNKDTEAIADMAADYLFNKVKEMQEMLTAIPDHTLRPLTSVMDRASNITKDRTWQSFVKLKCGSGKQGDNYFRESYNARYAGFFKKSRQQLSEMLGLGKKCEVRDHFGSEQMRYLDAVFDDIMIATNKTDIANPDSFISLVKEVAGFERKLFMETYIHAPESPHFFLRENYKDAERRIKKQHNLLQSADRRIMLEKAADMKIEEIGMIGYRK